MTRMLTPGIYRQDVFLPPAAELRTGVPAFLGLAAQVPQARRLGSGGVGHDRLDKLEAGAGSPEIGRLAVSRAVTRWPEFEQHFGPPLDGAFLSHAVRGFFDNGGTLCYVVPVDAGPDADAENNLAAGLAAIERLDGVDLLCAPEVAAGPAAVRLQRRLLDHCRTTGDRFAILDSRRGDGRDAVRNHRADLSAENGALYYPWVRTLDGPQTTGGLVPPCGHVAGVYARSDARVGVHKAPANEVLEGVLDLEVVLTDGDQGELNPEGVNCLRAFPGRGIRVWGARTLSDQPAWTYVSVRRVFLTLGRWIERHLAGVPFEPNEPALWARIRRQLTAYLSGLYRRGVFKGATAEEAFYVACDADTNPREVRDIGMVITEIGLAAAVPGEFLVVRILHRPGGVTLTGPAAAPIKS